jgi:hypothetical protein
MTESGGGQIVALSLSDSVTGDFLRVALDEDSGKLRHDNVLAEAVRGCLLIDLARLGHLSYTDGRTEVDTTPTGMALVDELIDEVNAHPTREMQVWLQRGLPHLHECIAELLADGLWTVKRHGIFPNHARYIDRDALRYQHLHETLLRIIEGKQAPADERHAALAAVVTVTNLAMPSRALHKPSAHLLHACGSLAWIVGDVTTFLYDAQGTDLAAGLANAESAGLQIGSI